MPQHPPVIFQSEGAECGLACLAMVSAHHGAEVQLAALRRRHSFSLRGANVRQLIDIAASLGFQARALKLEIEDLHALKLPAVLHWNFNHFVVLDKIHLKNGEVSGCVIRDPASGRRTISFSRLSSSFTGIALELSLAPSFQPLPRLPRFRWRSVLGRIDGAGPALVRLGSVAFAQELLALAGPLFLQFLLDGPIGSADTGLLTVGMIGVLVTLCFQAVAMWSRSWSVVALSSQIKLQWMSNVFAHLLRLPLPYFEKRQLGDIAARFNAIHTINGVVSTKLLEVLMDGLLSVLLVLVMCFYSAKLSLIVVLAAVCYFAVRRLVHTRLQALNEEHAALQSQESSIFLESVYGIQAIKLNNFEAARHAGWHNKAVAGINKRIAAQRLEVLLSVTRFLTVGLQNCWVLGWGTLLVVRGSMSAGMLFAFLAYKGSFDARIYSLIDNIQELRLLNIHGARLADIVHTPAEPGDGEADPVLAEDEPIRIEFQNVAFRYSEADPWVLRDLSFTVHSGESVAIVGPSGCGKTTILKLLIGSLSPTQGQILINGRPLERFGLHRFRAHLGVVMQEDQLFAGSIAQNIAFFDEVPDQQRILGSAQAASIAEEIEQMPMGFETLIGDRGAAVSGGQKQRILLARALYKSPQLLVLDEATSHLDTTNERKVNAAIKDRRVTRVFVAHRVETIMCADRILKLFDGHLVASDRPVMSESTELFA